MDTASERLRKERRVSFLFASGQGFLLRMVIWCKSLPRHPGTKTSVEVFSVSHLRAGGRGLDESMVLANVHDHPAWSLFIYGAGRLPRNH